MRISSRFSARSAAIKALVAAWLYCLVAFMPKVSAAFQKTYRESDLAISGAGLLPDTRVAFWGPNTGKVNDAVSQALDRIFLGDQDVDEAFAQAQEEAQAALSGQ